METKLHAKDVAALLSRACHRDGGSYRDFSSNKPQFEAPGRLPASQVSVEAANNNVPGVPGRAGTYPDQRTLSLDRLLAGIQSRKSQPANAATKIAVFSLAGGVGKTTLATALGRLLSGRMHQVVLANCDSNFGLQHLRGSYSQTVGAFTFVHAPEHTAAFPMALIEAGEYATADERESALKMIRDSSLQADTMLLDLPANRSAHTLECLRTADHILIPLSPDMHSAVTLGWLEELMKRERATGAGRSVHYIINRYDGTRSVHRDMRDRLQSTLGKSLLPFAIREEQQVQDAMRSGLTVIDYAPQSGVVVDLKALGKWVEQLLPQLEFARGMTA